MAMPKCVFLDAGVLIGALLKGDPRHAEAKTLVEAARRGQLKSFTSAGVLGEVYAALTWEKTEPRHSSQDAAGAVGSIWCPPSCIVVLAENGDSLTRALALAAAHDLRARRFHDARHAGVALIHGVLDVLTYDLDDWRIFASEGIRVIASLSPEWNALLEAAAGGGTE